jgi:uncharacterized protein (DUF2336 family)
MIVRNPAFPNLDGLVGLAKNDGVDIRPTLLRVLTDLYVQKPKHSPEETRHYTELALRLIEAVDVQVRATIAVRLARHPDAPLPVIHTLARDVIEVARPVLQHARGLSQRELLKIAQEFGQAYAAVIATRPDFAPGTTVAETAPADAIEAAATPAPAARSANPAEELSELFFSADAAERRLILLNLDFAPLPQALPIAAAVAQEANQRLEMTAMQRDAAGFAQELERVFGIARPHARRLADDMSGETVVVAAKALQMPPAMLQRVLLFLNPAIGQSVARVYELSALHEEITTSAALRLLAIWQEIHPREARRSHQAYYWHGAKDEAQRPVQRGAQVATPAERRARS